ncbi:hsp70-like protein [Cryptococcus deuterogattii 2001/935-1]|nr:hsp70-like protein [Cryptococcus deuterogattii 2001/935-1]
MPDINELLRWSIANSTAPNADASEQLQIRFNPNSTQSGTSTLHASDSGLSDISPASTPGPATPKDGSSLPLPPGAEVAGAKREDLTSEMLDLILGKGDSITMKEKMAFATDESNSVEDRVEALDDFEMLIELIDNANNMPILKLWDPLLSLLSSPHPEIVAHTCWIIGTAIQNNIKAQAAFYIHETFSRILNIIYPPSSTSSYPPSVRAKATYALSAALKHWPLASYALHTSSSSENGYSTLKRGVNDPEAIVRRKMAFLVGTLAMQSGERYEGEIPSEVRNYIEENEKNAPTESLVEGLKREGVFTALVEGLKQGVDDVEYEENAMRTLVRAHQKGGLTVSEKSDVKTIWEKWGKQGRQERGLDGEDGREISDALSA